MGYVLRVRLASFFTGAATASFIGLYILHRDYKLARDSIAQQVSVVFIDVNLVLPNFQSQLQMKDLHESLDRRISSLEKLKQPEAPRQAEATE